MDELGGTIAVREVDMSDHAASEVLAQTTVDRFGRMNVLVNDTGADPLDLVERGDVAAFTKVVHTDMYGVVHTSRAAIKP